MLTKKLCLRALDNLSIPTDNWLSKELQLAENNLDPIEFKNQESINVIKQLIEEHFKQSEVGTMERLNTMDSFTKGFKIKRDGRIITLTREEMVEFYFFDKAVDGRNCLDCYSVCCYDDDLEVIEALKEDANKCFEIEDRILDILFSNRGDTEIEVVSDVIEKNK